MKKNNQGFMLAEVIIVTTVLIGVMVTLYTGFNRVYSAYEQRNKYFDIDTLYANKVLHDYFIDELVINKMVNDVTITDNINIMKSNASVNTWNTEYFVDNTFINSLANNYNIISIYLIKNKDVTISDLNETFTEYLTYLKNNENSTDILLIIERKVGDNYYYSNVKVLK